MSTIESVESFTLGALWGGVLFTILSRFMPSSHRTAIGASHAVCGVMGYYCYNEWNTDRNSGIPILYYWSTGLYYGILRHMFQFEFPLSFDTVMYYPNQIMKSIFGFEIPEKLTYREIFYFSCFSDLTKLLVPLFILFKHRGVAKIKPSSTTVFKKNSDLKATEPVQKEVNGIGHSAHLGGLLGGFIGPFISSLLSSIDFALPEQKVQESDDEF